VQLVESGASREARISAVTKKLLAADEYVRRVINFGSID
jgi:hypothetical protein